MKCFLALIVFLFSISITSFSQWNEDFSDGDLEGWYEDTGHFIINQSHLLQLNAPEGSLSSRLFRSSTFTDSMSWEIYFKLEFSPSTSNQLRIYLGLDQDDITTASGYFLEVGASGNEDAIEFKFLNEGTAEPIASSAPGIVASEPVEIKLRIIRDKTGNWTFYNISPEFPEMLFTAQHDIISSGQLDRFGLFAKYSDTRRDKFFFDDIMISTTVPDTADPDYTLASPNEILITEIMADPSPRVGLPESEYIELYNADDEIFMLSDYYLQAGSLKRNLPDSLLMPGEFVAIVDASAANDFQKFSKVIAIDNFPALANGGATVSIKNIANEIIHNVTYTPDWYKDQSKASGGWSLELINPLHLCSIGENWTACIHLQGGTPGAVNSVWNETEDMHGPQLISLYASDEYTIEVRFDELLDTFIMTDPALYKFEPDIEIENIQITEDRIVIISISSALLKQTAYALLPFDAYDCLGNFSTTDTVIFGAGEPAVPGDLLINELLFNPESGGSRFIELANAGEKFIDLRGISIGRAGTGEIYPLDISEIVGPGTLFVICEHKEDILGRYVVANPEMLFEADLPAWDEDTDNASVIGGGMIIDSLTYSSMWHHPVIADQNGVSLERVSVVAGTQEPSNWHSAASTQGAATPTGINSQAKVLPVIQSPFSIINKQFSPNNDGFNDFMLMKFELDPGLDVGSIWVYDLAGREIHQILSNETIGTSAMIQWDGRNAKGVVANMGIYVIFVELWDTAGRVRHFQESVALVNR